MTMSHRRVRTLIVLAVVPMVAIACGSGTKPAAVSAPASPTPKVTTPAPAPGAVAGVYRTKWFLPGLRLTRPAHWSVDSDMFSELSIVATGRQAGTVRISKGLYPIDMGGGFLTTKCSPGAVVTALRGNPDLTVAGSGSARLGDGLRAMTADLSINSRAAQKDFQYMSYRGTGNVNAFAIKGKMRVRLYTAVVRQGFGPDLLNLVAEAPNAHAFRAWTQAVERVLSTLRLPAGIRAA